MHQKCSLPDSIYVSSVAICQQIAKTKKDQTLTLNHTRRLKLWNRWLLVGFVVMFAG
jgi:hypothetical protein